MVGALAYINAQPVLTSLAFVPPPFFPTATTPTPLPTPRQANTPLPLLSPIAHVSRQYSIPRTPNDAKTPPSVISQVPVGRCGEGWAGTGSAGTYPRFSSHAPPCVRPVSTCGM
ncbi:hypothetical protein DFH09DRAFT_1289269 [Mycena vulgaris]|nr:hypothetical protein DFH09DRAFT_1289269 [Mycena vulgaris]